MSFYAGRGAYANTKRARKMSAFVPMRGRKDGRDSPWAVPDAAPSTIEWRSPGTGAGYLGAPMREAEQASELSLVRSAQLGEQAAAPSHHLQGRLLAIPRQFADQLELIGEQMARQRAAAAASMAPGPAQEPAIEAKFRRAFHPMRGKKSEGLGVLGVPAADGDGEASGQAEGGFVQQGDAQYEPGA